MGSGQQKLSNPAIFCKSTPTHTAFLTASSTAATAIAPASISEYRGDKPQEITNPFELPWMGAITAASPGPSLFGPTNGLIAV